MVTASLEGMVELILSHIRLMAVPVPEINN